MVVQWDIHMQFGRHICSGAYVNNVKCMYASAYGDIVYCIEFYEHIYWHSCLICAHELNGMCGISMAFDGIFVIGIYMDIAWRIKVAVWCFIFRLYVQQYVVYMKIVLSGHLTKKDIAPHLVLLPQGIQWCHIWSCLLCIANGSDNGVKTKKVMLHLIWMIFT